MQNATVKGDDVTLTVGAHVLKVPASKKKPLLSTADTTERQLFSVSVRRMYMTQKHSSATHLTASSSPQIKVYELLGAEVFLYFDVEGTQMTARVNPRTTLRTGDKAVFALDMEKIHVSDKDTELTITN